MWSSRQEAISASAETKGFSWTGPQFLPISYQHSSLRVPRWVNNHSHVWLEPFFCKRYATGFVQGSCSVFAHQSQWPCMSLWTNDVISGAGFTGTVPPLSAMNADETASPKTCFFSQNSMILQSTDSLWIFPSVFQALPIMWGLHTPSVYFPLSLLQRLQCVVQSQIF